MSDEVRIVARAAEIALLEAAELLQAGPLLRVIHRFRDRGMECQPGEEVWAVYVIVRGREIPLALSLTLRLLIDYLARTRHVAQSAAQITAGIRASPFYERHGMNSGIMSRRRFSRSGIKEYIKRIRKALALALRGASCHLDPHRVLVSKTTMTNEKLYQLRARVEWLHLD
jgi:hypothetical protein